MSCQESGQIQPHVVYGYACTWSSDFASQILSTQIQALREKDVKNEHIFSDIVVEGPKLLPGLRSLFSRLHPGDTIYLVRVAGQGLWVENVAMHMYGLLPWTGVEVSFIPPTDGTPNRFKQPPGRPPKLGANEVQKCRQMSSNGATLRTIAREVGCSSTTVRNVLKGVGPYAPNRLERSE